MNKTEKLTAFVVAALLTALTVWLVLGGLGWLMPYWQALSSHSQRTIQVVFYFAFSATCLGLTVRHLLRHRNAGSGQSGPGE
jgi:sterol desaturase/sphingolipid hydroxylase (fatty acid hydroxylase superfamily)